MNQFKDFGITVTSKAFVGDKIKIERILNVNIQVHDFKIEPSKFEKGNGKRLCLQITLGDTKRIIFTSSMNLMDMVQQVPADKFPFSCTIIRENEGFYFT